jgi:hypothetical protein
MEKEEENLNRRQEIRRNKYNLGMVTQHSSAADPINGNYEQTNRGKQLKQAEIDRDVRAAIRGRAIEVNTNSNYDVINGLPRQVREIPSHERYNPANAQDKIVDHAGKPLRANSNT